MNAPFVPSILTCAVFLAVTPASSGANSQTSARELNDAEKWVVAQATAGEIADLDTALNADQTKKFPEEKDRKLRARFLERLLTGVLPGFKPHRNGARIIGAIIDEPIDLRNAQIPSEVWLEHCQFNQSVDFRHANFAGLVLFDGSTFKRDASFDDIKIGYIASFQETIFEGLVEFKRANIASTFSANNAQFRNKEKGASFNSMKIGHAAFFKGAVFEGPVNFVAAQIASAFIWDEAKFHNKRELADFRDIKVGGIAFFQEAVFEGPVYFAGAHFADAFIATFATFKSRTAWISMECGGKGDFGAVTFAGSVEFADSSFLDLKITSIEFKRIPIPLLDLSRASIKRQLSVQWVTIHTLVAPFLHVAGPADFTHVTVEKSADLSYGDFTELDLLDSAWPTDAKELHIEGISYKYIRAAPNEHESHVALLKLANDSAYAADVYTSLEEFFLRHGYRADADRAFISGKHRERKQLPLWQPAWLGSMLLNLLVGYGRHPWQAMIPCAGLVLMGCLLFAGEKMELQKKPEQGDAPRVYNPFWYSLSLFVPFVDLQSHTVWKPKDDCLFLRHYMRVHTLLGWILIPILLAAISGLIK